MGLCVSALTKTESTGLNSNNKVSGILVPQNATSEGEILQSSNLKSYTYAELETATGHFHTDNVLGKGGFGVVFKGWIDENSLAAAEPGIGMLIAVKRLDQNGSQGYKEWLAEVNYLGRFSHPHLVRLIGYCLEGERHLLVYEFMSLGSMEDHLFRRGSSFQHLSWSLILKVALAAAQGLAFLHSADPIVIHRDFKTSNVLLDSDYNAKLSDFGLAKDGPIGDKSHVSTKVMGTDGYADPEYIASDGHLTTKSDVYSFGVVLLEMICGRRVIDRNQPAELRNLVKWAKPYLSKKRKVFTVFDSQFEGQYSAEEAYKVAALALKCLSESKRRPNMDEVVGTLEQVVHSQLSRTGSPVVTREKKAPCMIWW